MTQEQVDSDRAEALIWEAQRYLKDIELDFEIQFAQNRRQCVDTIEKLREYLAADDEQGINQFLANLQDAANLQVGWALPTINKFVGIAHPTIEQLREYLAADDEQGINQFLDDLTGGSPILSPRRPNPTPHNNDSAHPPIDDPFL